jgi:hypothetical protein
MSFIKHYMSYKEKELSGILGEELKKRAARCQVAGKIRDVINTAIFKEKRDDDKTNAEKEISGIVEKILKMEGAVMDDLEFVNSLDIKDLIPTDDALMSIREYAEKGWHLIKGGPAKSTEFGPEKMSEIESRYGKENVKMWMTGGFTSDGQHAQLILFFVKESVLEKTT